MRVAITLAALTSVASSIILPRQESNDTSSAPVVVASQYDGYVKVMLNMTQGIRD